MKCRIKSCIFISLLWMHTHLFLHDNIYIIIKYNIIFSIIFLFIHFKNYYKNNLYKFRVTKSKVTNKQYNMTAI